MIQMFHVSSSCCNININIKLVVTICFPKTHEPNRSIVTQDEEVTKRLQASRAGLQLTYKWDRTRAEIAVSILGIQAAQIHKVNEKLTSPSFLAYIIYIPVIFMVCVICLLCFVDQQCPRDWGYLAKIRIIMINDCVCKKKLRVLF